MALLTRVKKHQISAKRMAEFDQRPDEDPYQWIARQLDIATPFEGAWLMMLREDEKQHRAFQLLQLAKTERAARHTKWAMIATIPISVISLAISIVSLNLK